MRRALIACVPVLLLSACPDAAPEPPPPPAPSPEPPAPLPEPNPELAPGFDREALAALLRDPPHLPASLRGLLARELAHRVQRAGAEGAYREALAQLGAELRARGALGADFAAELATRERAAATRLAATVGAEEPAFFAAYLDPSPKDPAASEAGLARALRLAQRGRQELMRRRAVVGLVLLPASSEQLAAAASAARAADAPPILASALRAQGLDPAPVPGAETLLFDAAAVAAVEAATQRPPAELEVERAELDARLAALDAKLEQIAGALTAVAADVRRATTSYAAGIDGFVAEDPSASMAQRRGRLAFAESGLHDSRPVDQRAAELDAEDGPYRYVTPEDRQTMKLALKQETENRKRIDAAFAQAGKATQVAGEVVDLLVSFEALSPETAQDIHKGLDVTRAGLDLVTAVAMGDPLSAISAGVDLCYLLTGKEPPPSPEEARHEAVMQALDGLAEGQREIKAQLAELSRQVEEVHMELHQVHRIARSTHAIVVDQNLLGLRDCRDFLRSQRFYAATRPDPASGEPVLRPDLGLADYGQLLAHFAKGQERELYTSASRFLNDQLRGDVLRVLQVAADDEQANQLRASIAQDLGQEPEWVQDRLLEDDAQSAALLQFVSRYVAPELRPRVLGSLAYPVADVPSLVAKLERVLDPEASAPFAAAYATYGLDQALDSATNPILVEEVVASAEALQPYRLIQLPGETTLPGFEAVAAPGYDPARSFGATRGAQHEQLLEPLHASDRLLRRCLAQNALRTGDVLIPVLAALTNFAHPGIGSSSSISRYVDGLLAKNASLRENVVRYLVYVELKAPGRYPELHALATRLLSKPYANPPTRYPFVERQRQLVQSSYVERVAQPAPRWRDPRGLRTRERVVREAWPEGAVWKQFYEGLNLNGDLPQSPSAAARAIRQLDPRYGSEFVVENRFQREEVYTRLPRPEEVVAGSLIQSSLLAPLSERQASLWSTRVDYAVCFPPDASEEELDRLHRELLLRELTRAANAR